MGDSIVIVKHGWTNSRKNKNKGSRARGEGIEQIA